MEGTLTLSLSPVMAEPLDPAPAVTSFSQAHILGVALLRFYCVQLGLGWLLLLFGSDFCQVEAIAL
jgi:hypothetical protein